ncbi:MAG TPA: hypothetical protein VFN41_07795 [Candidatus Limnocylindrales bacterium]|nr:hypothetical protein [Candidatus Limnocylindrales bacterium]
MTDIGTVPRLTLMALATLSLAGCSTPSPSRPVTPDDKIKAAVADVGFGAAQQLFRGNCEDRTCLLVADADDPRRIALIVLGPEAPYKVEASTTGEVGAEPATLDEMGTDDREFVYGRVDDSRISKLELDLSMAGSFRSTLRPRGTPSPTLRSAAPCRRGVSLIPPDGSSTSRRRADVPSERPAGSSGGHRAE